MDQSESEWKEKVNRVRCVASRTTMRYQLRIEDWKGNPLTAFVELSAAESRYALQHSLPPGDPWDMKEDIQYPEYNVEDYRIPIVNENILRARLYPES